MEKNAQGKEKGPDKWSSSQIVEVRLPTLPYFPGIDN